MPPAVASERRKTLIAGAVPGGLVPSLRGGPFKRSDSFPGSSKFFQTLAAAEGEQDVRRDRSLRGIVMEDPSAARKPVEKQPEQPSLAPGIVERPEPDAERHGVGRQRLHHAPGALLEQDSLEGTLGDGRDVRGDPRSLRGSRAASPARRSGVGSSTSRHVRVFRLPPTFQVFQPCRDRLRAAQLETMRAGAAISRSSPRRFRNSCATSQSSS